ncbi:PR domain zinc finger protein 13 [Bagarius yarrelli]|uniref:PR domain zinc finger protein 13 n=1 Tax=Bagarius yarrelli TaxID=175774 RepID=A0A556U6G9_BAGYA|nr:PR domain zinc finger protein 13 [Bagarius yarrelli]
MQANRTSSSIGVFTDCSIPAGARLGPVPGIFRLGKSVSDRKEVEVKKKVRLVRGEFVDECGSSVSEWILLIRAARNSQEQNLEAVSDLPGGQIFYRALREIPVGEELSVWYSEVLAQWFHIPTTATPTHDEKGEERYICWYCWRIFRYPNTLKAHVHFHCALSYTRTPISHEHAPRGTPDNTHFSRSPKSGDIPSVASASPFTNKPATTGLLRRASQEEQDRALDMSVTALSRQHHGLPGGISGVPFHPATRSAFIPAGSGKIFNHADEATNGDAKANTTLSFGKPSQVSKAICTPVDSGPRGFSLLSHFEETSAFKHVSPGTRYPHVPPGITFERFSLPPSYTGDCNSVPLVPFTVYNGELLYSSPYYPLKFHLLRYPDSVSSYFSAPGFGADVNPTCSPADREMAVHVEKSRARLEPLPSVTHAHAAAATGTNAVTGKQRKGHLCLYCGKLYSRKYGLKIHMRTHTGYKPLKCKVCFRPFGDPSNLNKHVRLHAEGNTPYRCDYCGKVLVRRRDLERHVKSRHPGHQGIKKRSSEEEEHADDHPEEPKSDEDSDVDVCCTVMNRVKFTEATKRPNPLQYLGYSLQTCCLHLE